MLPLVLLRLCSHADKSVSGGTDTPEAARWPERCQQNQDLDFCKEKATGPTNKADSVPKLTNLEKDKWFYVL